ncbi:type IV pilin protein [Candidatus Magnetominusculus xianensis]|uniref:Type II secretory pathway pseudopilin PulG n=1 Tax=Candidatus Magnetominusculus xianensis TaxID=1748249 RepID=A0ABR5SKL3_9BACT|nr:type IV pilin protein [Candidatus Magnetominusculus xianensis]KWT87802.1 putative type II secretory pathway pseudopilin PulG [Candidatus Magnetominusculus xianensis]MBF0405483.1 prepilin-type N-terminal cleavage/methylation domain-containing protein [Nitrospirota bacterium]
MNTIINTMSEANRLRAGRDQKGFTLAELLITMVIIGILSAVAIPMYMGQREKARRTEAAQNVQSLRLLMEQYFTENGCYYAPCSTLTDQAISGAAAIQTFLPAWKPGNTSGLLFNYRIEVNTNKTTYNIGAIASGGTVSSGASCAAGELKIDNNNNKCGF